MSLPSFVAITKIDLEKSTKMQFQTCKMATISPRSRSFDNFPRSRSFTDKVPLTPSNVPTKFHWKNSVKMQFQTRKNNCSFGRSRSFEVPFADNVSLTTSNVWESPPSFIGIAKTDLEKCAKMLFQILKLATISPRSRSFEVNFMDNVPLTPAMSLPSFIGISKIEFEKCVKSYFRPLKWLPFPEVKVT